MSRADMDRNRRQDDDEPSGRPLATVSDWLTGSSNRGQKTTQAKLAELLELANPQQSRPRSSNPRNSSSGNRHNQGRYQKAPEGTSAAPPKEDPRGPYKPRVDQSEEIDQIVALRSLCDKFNRSISTVPVTKNNVSAEETFWKEAQAFKKIPQCVQHLIGFYSLAMYNLTSNRTLVLTPEHVKQLLASGIQSPDSISHLTSSALDPYFLKTIAAVEWEQLFPHNGQLIYSILIRLGDLHRYLKDTVPAKKYYLAAQERDPSRGHAYNQLALVSASPFETVYNYARAAAATTDPTKLGANNLKHFVDNCKVPALKQIFSDSNSIQDDSTPLESITERDLLYLVVGAIYKERVLVVVPLILGTLLKLAGQMSPCSSEEELSSFCRALVSFDLALQSICTNENCEELKMNLVTAHYDSIRKLRAIMTNKFGPESHAVISSVDAALFHDSLLRGFSPLQLAHESLNFEPSELLSDIKLRNPATRATLVARTGARLDTLPRPGFGRKSRNVALESILGQR